MLSCTLTRAANNHYFVKKMTDYFDAGRILMVFYDHVKHIRSELLDVERGLVGTVPILHRSRRMWPANTKKRRTCVNGLNIGEKSRIVSVQTEMCNYNSDLPVLL